MSLVSLSKTVLLVADDALYIYMTGGKGVRLVEAVPWNSANFENNVAAIISKDCRGRPVLVTNDMVEQHYRKELVQKAGVSYFDRKGLVDQKLSVAFSNYPIRAAFSLKEKSPSSANRRLSADIYIFTAIPLSDPFEKTLGAVRESLAGIVGFCLLPVESSSMVKALVSKIAAKRAEKSVWAVFVGQHKNGSLRQVVTKNGELALTRMSPIIDTDADPERWATEVVQEVKTTVSYLSRVGYKESEGLDVIIIANPASGSLLEDLVDTPCHLTTLTSLEAERLLGLKVAPQEDLRYADVLHAGWIAKKSSLKLPLFSKGIDEVLVPRRFAFAASCLFFTIMCILAYLIFSGFQEINLFQRNLGDALASESQLKVRYEREVEQKEALGIDVRLLKAAETVHQELEENKISESPLFDSIGKALGPDLKLDSLKILRQTDFVKKDPLNRTKGGGGHVYELNLRLVFPSTANIDQGNQEVRSFRDRLQSFLPDHTVRVDKFLKDYGYTDQIVLETGDLENSPLDQDFVVEIVVVGPSV